MKAMASRLTGVIAPMVTPFDDNEDFDERATRDLTRWLVEQGVQGLYPGSGCGEVWKLSLSERKRLIDVVVEAAEGKVLVLPGTGAGSTREAIHLAQYAKDNGADAAVVWPPYFAGEAYSDDAIFDHFKTVAMIQGWETLFLPSLAVGSPAGITSAVNVCPRLMARMYKAVRAGDIQAARDVHAGLISLVCAEPWVTDQFQAMKEGLRMLGVPVGSVRRPWFSAPFTDEQKQELRSRMAALGPFD